MLLLGPLQGSGGPPNLRPTPNVAKLTQLLNFNQLIKDFLLDRPSNLGVLKKNYYYYFLKFSQSKSPSKIILDHSNYNFGFFFFLYHQIIVNYFNFINNAIINDYDFKDKLKTVIIN